jgi:hypothetical protein
MIFKRLGGITYFSRDLSFMLSFSFSWEVTGLTLPEFVCLGSGPYCCYPPTSMFLVSGYSSFLAADFAESMATFNLIFVRLQETIPNRIPGFIFDNLRSEVQGQDPEGSDHKKLWCCCRLMFQLWIRGEMGTLCVKLEEVPRVYNERTCEKHPRTTYLRIFTLELRKTEIRHLRPYEAAHDSNDSKEILGICTLINRSPFHQLKLLSSRWTPDVPVRDFLTILRGFKLILLCDTCSLSHTNVTLNLSFLCCHSLLKAYFERKFGPGVAVMEYFSKSLYDLYRMLGTAYISFLHP